MCKCNSTNGDELESHPLIFDTIFTLFNRVENLEKHLDEAIGQVNRVTKWINDRGKKEKEE